MSDYTPPNTRLLAYLKKGSPKYHGKVFEVGEVIQGWLSYVTETFPHYTRHTIEHSEQIVQQISNLLFKDDAPEPVIRLSAVEAYILIASAYFHDAGMVASNAEKEQILKSNAWNTWIQGNGGGAKRWREIQNFREGQSPPDNAVRHFLADTVTRHLIAEYIRREHHSRAATVIERHQASLGRFAFDDPKLQRTISDVCIAHGLRHHDLEDRQRYPDERDIRNEKVNVRFMAIFLRLRDLLDMDSNRACPLLLNAACPVPADSLAHWTQYQRITHRTTTPERIEIHAECKTQDEHRVLQDWCQWLVDETQHAYTLMARSKRHSGWKPPFAKFGENSIVIQPANDANYIFFHMEVPTRPGHHF